MLKKLTRLPKRTRDDIYIISLLKNWMEVLSSKLKGRDFAILRFRNGLVIESPPEIRLEMLFHEVWVEEMYSPANYKILPNDTVLDIGANIGVFSIFAATVADNVRVLSFEPFPSNANWLEKNVMANGLPNVKVFRKAVSGEGGNKTLYISDAWVGHSLNIDHDHDHVDEVDIECVTLDEVLSKISICNLLKIDCEGSEYDVFYPASDNSLKKIEKIVGEFHEIDTEKKNGKALCSFLMENGFEITHFEDFGNGTGSFCARRSNKE